MLNLDNVRKAADKLENFTSCADDPYASSFEYQQSAEVLRGFAALLTSTEPITAEGCERLGMDQHMGSYPQYWLSREPSGAVVADTTNGQVTVVGGSRFAEMNMGQLAALIIALTPQKDAPHER